MARKRQDLQFHQQSRGSFGCQEVGSISRKRSRQPKQHQKEENYISGRLTEKILKEAMIQQKEIEDEDKVKTPFSTVAEQPEATWDSDGNEYEEDSFLGYSETESQYDGEFQEIDEVDEKILAAFMNRDAPAQHTLADVIVQRIKENNADAGSENRPFPDMQKSTIDMYRRVGQFLSRFTTGKVPKAFKSIPSYERWEDVLYLTEPEKWSPHFVFQATKIFASSFNAKKAQRFYNLVLLPRIRNDIKKDKRLHFCVYQALKKSLYKPASFFKGILFPLCRSGTCSLREAVIVGSIIEKVSIPLLHSSVALLKLAEMEYCGTTSYFIKIFLDKKYSLPYRVLDSLVGHFLRFVSETRIMPVIWHQSLLAFAQRYRNQLTKDQKNDLEHLMQCQKHYLVTPEIRRELKNSCNRGESEHDLMLTSSAISVVNSNVEDRWDIPEVPMEED